MGRGRVAGAAAAVATCACVSYDPAGPAVPPIDGTYATIIAITFVNELELRHDTLLTAITLRGTGYRGRFTGFYRFTNGDSGRVGGMLRPEGLLTVTDFGAPPTPIANVRSVQRLYPRCDFLRLGTGPLPGELRGDSLLAIGRGSVPCLYPSDAATIEVGTELELTIVGVRGQG